MIPSSFEYLKATSVDEALSALAGDEDAKVLAGGQSFLPLLRLRLAYPSTVIDLAAVDELRGVRDDGSHLIIGAMTTHHDVLTDPTLKEQLPLLVEATGTVADPAVRHRGTLGGALAHADPAGDLPAVALALDAEFVIAGASGRRTVAAAQFFTDYLATAIAPDEVLVEIRFPKLPGYGWGVRYEKFHRVAQAWAIVAVATAVRRENGSIAEARIGLTNMGTTPIRASSTEQALAGVPATVDAVRAAAQRAADGTSPSSDLNAQADYREHLARVLTARAVGTAAGL